MIQERVHGAPSGVLALIVLLLALALDIVLFALGIVIWGDGGRVMVIIASVLLLFVLIMFPGLFAVSPCEARVLQFFGNYVGTVRSTGLRYTNPLYTKRRISLRLRNLAIERFKVNDAEGNPIEVEAVVVWKVVDTAVASFRFDDYINFLNVQSELAVRDLATQYPYDTQSTEELSLRSNTEEIADQLREDIQDRLHEAGVEVLEVRMTHLAYAPEMASAMLQRQQAGAIIAARSQIVEGAVSMVQMALEDLSARNVVEFNEDRKAAMVSNLLVVLCGDKGTQPVLSTDNHY